MPEPKKEKVELLCERLEALRPTETTIPFGLILACRILFPVILAPLFLGIVAAVFTEGVWKATLLYFSLALPFILAPILTMPGYLEREDGADFGDLKWWEVLMFLFPRKTRIEILEPQIFELWEDWIEAKARCKSWARLFDLRIIFAFRLLWILVSTLLVAARAVFGKVLLGFFKNWISGAS